jgi:hypothetical protein
VLCCVVLCCVVLCCVVLCCVVLCVCCVVLCCVVLCCVVLCCVGLCVCVGYVVCVLAQVPFSRSDTEIGCQPPSRSDVKSAPVPLDQMFGASNSHVQMSDTHDSHDQIA